MHKKRIDPNNEYDAYMRLGSDYHWQWLLESKNRKNQSYSYYNYLEYILKRISYNIKKTKSKTILDAGCGDAVLLYLISKKFPNLKLSGFDFIESAIQVGKKKLRQGNLFVFDIRDIFSYNQRFDYIICTEVIDHVNPPETINSPKNKREFQKKIINKLISMANKGLFLTIPTKGVWRDLNKEEDKKEESSVLIEWIQSFNYKFSFYKIFPILNYFEKNLNKIRLRRPEKLISIANNLKKHISSPTREDWSCSDTNKEYKKEEKYLIDWLEDLKLTCNWDFLRHDKKHPKSTYYLELEK